MRFSHAIHRAQGGLCPPKPLASVFHRLPHRVRASRRPLSGARAYWWLSSCLVRAQRLAATYTASMNEMTAARANTAAATLSGSFVDQMPPMPASSLALGRRLREGADRLSAALRSGASVCARRRMLRALQTGLRSAEWSQGPQRGCTQRAALPRLHARCSLPRLGTATKGLVLGLSAHRRVSTARPRLQVPGYALCVAKAVTRWSRCTSAPSAYPGPMAAH